MAAILNGLYCVVYSFCSLSHSSKMSECVYYVENTAVNLNHKMALKLFPVYLGLHPAFQRLVSNCRHGVGVVMSKGVFVACFR